MTQPLAGARPRRSPMTSYRPIASAMPLPSAHVAVIDDSHDRCAALGLSRFESPDLSPLARSELAILRERNRRLYAHAAPVMEMLFEQIVHTQSMLVLCDVTGTVLHSLGDDDFLVRASKVALQPGAQWSESVKGTNAVGTALISEMPTLVHADEHFLHANHFLTCSAAPILDPRGNVLGVLDVSGDYRSYHQHTMSLVTMSARMIENHWLSDDYRHVMRLHFHSRADTIGTLKEGLLAVTAEGRIVGANRSALEQLGMSGAAVRMQSVVSLFGVSIGALVQHFRSPLAAPFAATLQDGQVKHLLARFDWPVWHTISEAAAAAAATGEAQVDAPFVQAGRAAHARAASNPAAPSAQSASMAAMTSVVRTAAMSLAAMAGGDKTMASMVLKARRALDRDIPILILGETGTGKELLARAMHDESRRRDRPFVAVNCASIPATLIEAELFGYEEGAFTGARRKGQVGKILQAQGGTLLLDEIGDMPLALQAHLLRVLQERQVLPLGSRKAVAVDITILCATHRNLRDMMAAKTFREDLYYRLNGLALKLPALRERSDLLQVAERMVAQLVPQHTPRLSPDVQNLLQRFPWPGNMRQLDNVLRMACLMAQGEPTINKEHLPDDFLEEVALALTAHTDGPGVGAARAHPDANGGKSLESIEVDAIQREVDACGGNILAASKRLGISRNTIYRKLRWNPPSA